MCVLDPKGGEAIEVGYKRQTVTSLVADDRRCLMPRRWGLVLRHERRMLGTTSYGYRSGS